MTRLLSAEWQRCLFAAWEGVDEHTDRAGMISGALTLLTDAVIAYNT
jgi:hypothetical protein